MTTKLSEAEIAAELRELTGWRREGESIVRDVVAKNFRHALELVNSIGELAEAMDHHPDLLIHGWNKLRITLSTHSAGGLTKNDFSLARRLEPILAQAGC